MKGKKRISLLAVLVCMFALVFALALMSACGNTDDNTTSSNQWYYGAEVPADTLGHEGDYYLNTQTLASYVKSDDGTWTETAANWYYGTEEPVENLGATNDFYLNTESGELYQKNSNDWGSPILTLKGEQGKPGRDGVLWYSNKGNPNELKDEAALAGSYVGDFYLDTESFEVYQKTSDTKWEFLGSIKGRGTTWFDGSAAPADADLENVYEGDYYYRTFIDDEAKAEKYQIYRFENKAWTLKADVITADLSALYAPDGESYFNDNGDTVVLENSDKTATEVTIPGSYNGKSVEIGEDAFKGNTNLQSVTIEEGVTKIGDDAFNSCFGLTDVTIPESVTSIGDRAFEYTSITEIEISENVTHIGAYAFMGSYLTSVIFDENSKLTEIGDYVFSTCSRLQSVSIPESIAKIGIYAFSSCSQLKDIIFPEDTALTEIGHHAFYACSNLESIQLPNSITTLEMNTFDSCNSLKRIVLPLSLTNIGRYVFKDCYELTSITIPAGVNKIDVFAFNNCYRLVEVINLSGLTITVGRSDPSKITDYALYVTNDESKSRVKTDTNGFVFYEGGDEENTYLIAYHGSDTELTMPATSVDGNSYSVRDRAFNGYNKITEIAGLSVNMKSIGKSVFRGCANLETVEIPTSVTSIGDNAFDGCKRLKEITIPDGVTEIGKYAFNECIMLRSIKIPAGVTEIKESTFYCCYKLGSVTFAEGSQLTTIGKLAFFSCSSLTSITIPENVNTIDGKYDQDRGDSPSYSDGAFIRCYQLAEVINLSSHLTITKGQGTSGAVALYAKHVTTDSSESKVKTDENGFVFYEDEGGDGVYLLAYHGTDTVVKLPATSVDGHSYKIAKNAFYYEYNITYMNSLDALVKSIEISSGVTEIEENAVYMYSGLTNLKIDGNGSGLTINAKALSGCTNLATITFGGTVEEFDALLIKGNFLTGFASITVTCNGGTYTYVKGVRQS